MRSPAGVRFTSIAVSVVAVLVGGVATSVAAGSSQTARPVVSHVPAEPEAAVFHNWVALGDSYSSGEGSPPFDQGTNGGGNRCRRSSLGWPRLLRVEHHLACSGARIQHLYEGQMSAPDDRGQIARLTALNQSSPVDAVTITIGGNDIPFAGVIGDCYTQLVCSLGGVNDRIDQVAQQLADTNGNGVYRDIQNAAPSGEVIVVGYPRLFPTDYRDVVDNCRPASGAVFGFSRREVERLNAAAGYLDTQLRQAARRAYASYVSTLDALDGHELCTRDAWLRPIQASCYPLPVIGSALCGHPWERTDRPVKHGQQRIADIVRQVTHRPPPTLGVVWAPNQQGFGQVRPRRFYGGGTSTGLVKRLVWDSWGEAQATARGIGYYVPPNGYGYQARPEPANVVASDLGNCQGRTAYRRVDWYFPGQGQTLGDGGYFDICPN